MNIWIAQILYYIKYRPMTINIWIAQILGYLYAYSKVVNIMCIKWQPDTLEKNWVLRWEFKLPTLVLLFINDLLNILYMSSQS